MNHNLPSQPYKRFFGRKDAVNKIVETLIEGGTYIASIDGVGGIGKTALTYYFCQEYLIPKNDFDYLVWVTAKDTVFDAYSSTSKNVENKFKNNSVEELINETIKVTNFPELLVDTFEERKKFFEDVVKSEKIFFVIDNLETIQDENFFEFIKEFNKYSKNNRDLKVLTTSRKRKRIADFPIEIEGLSIADSLQMLDFLAENYSEKPIRAILSTSEFQKIKILNRVGNIPLGIEFIVGQLANGKDLGRIYEELEGYPTLENVKDEDEKRKRLSDILLFSFKDMYETLDTEHQLVFKIIAALQKNKRKNDNDASFDLVMNLTDFNKSQLEEILELLIENKLIYNSGKDEFGISQMAINFTKQYFEDFGEVEDKVIGLKEAIVKNPALQDNIDLFIERVRTMTVNLQFPEAEKVLHNAIERNEDYRLYYELAKVQTVLKKNSKASENYKRATELSPFNKNVWFDYITLERTSGRSHIALSIAKNAIDNTHDDVSIVILVVDIYKFKKEFENMRHFTKSYLDKYKSQNKYADFIKLLQHIKSVEFRLLKDEYRYKEQSEFYFDTIDLLVKSEPDQQIQLELLQEQIPVCRKFGKFEKIRHLENKICTLEQRIKSSIEFYAKQMNYFMTSAGRDIEKAKKYSLIILNYSDKKEDFNFRKNALRILLQIFSGEQDFEKIISSFDDYRRIGEQDADCLLVLNKAKKRKGEFEKEKINKEIMNSLTTTENELRSFIMNVFDNDELQFKLFIESNTSGYSINWIEQWKLTKHKSLNNNLPLIYYSDFSNLRRILEWMNNDAILGRKIANSSLYGLKNNIRNMVTNLKTYTIDERNETFHSRLLQMEHDKLNEVLVDTNRLLQLVKEVRDII